MDYDDKEKCKGRTILSIIGKNKKSSEYRRYKKSHKNAYVNQKIRDTILEGGEAKDVAGHKLSNNPTDTL